jgi:hypothetical protein
VSEFLRFGNTVVAVDKIVSVSFYPETQIEGATLTMNFEGSRSGSIQWDGEIAERIWAYWLRNTENKAGSQEQSS